MRALTSVALALLISTPVQAQDSPILFDTLGQETQFFLDTCIAHSLGNIDLRNPPEKLGTFALLPASEAKEFLIGAKGTAWRVGTHTIALSENPRICRTFSQSSFAPKVETDFNWLKETFFGKIKQSPISASRASQYSPAGQSHGFYLMVNRPIWPAVMLTTFKMPRIGNYNTIHTIRYVPASDASGG